MFKQKPPFYLSQMIAKAWVLYRATLKQCFWIALIYGICNQLLDLQITRHLTTNGTSLVLKQPVVLIGILIVTLILFTLATAWMMLKQNNTLFNNKIASEFQWIWHKLPMLFITSLIFYAAVMMGYLLYFIPGILIATCFYFYFPTILFGQIKFRHIFPYGFHLSRQHFLGVLGLVLFNFLIVSIPVGLVSLLFDQFASHIDFGLKEAVTILLQAFLLPFVISTTLTTFHHLQLELHKVSQQ